MHSLKYQHQNTVAMWLSCDINSVYTYCRTVDFSSGLPDRVEGIYSSICSTITLVWESAGPQLTYCVTVYNTTGDQQENTTLYNMDDVIGMNHTVCNLSDAHFMLTAADARPWHTFEFVVTAVSELGPGPPSARTAANFSLGRILYKQV